VYMWVTRGFGWDVLVDEDMVEESRKK
jgi:hypothetical protein